MIVETELQRLRQDRNKSSSAYWMVATALIVVFMAGYWFFGRTCLDRGEGASIDPCGGCPPGQTCKKVAGRWRCV
jgi:hypothetical protein